MCEFFTWKKHEVLRIAQIYSEKGQKRTGVSKKEDYCTENKTWPVGETDVQNTGKKSKQQGKGKEDDTEIQESHHSAPSECSLDEEWEEYNEMDSINGKLSEVQSSSDPSPCTESSSSLLHDNLGSIVQQYKEMHETNPDIENLILVFNLHELAVICLENNENKRASEFLARADRLVAAMKTSGHHPWTVFLLIWRMQMY